MRPPALSAFAHCVAYLALSGLLVSVSIRLDRLEGAALHDSTSARRSLAERLHHEEALVERVNELERRADIAEERCNASVTAAQFAAHKEAIDASLANLRRVTEARSESQTHDKLETAARRRTQRAGAGAEAAQILKIQTRHSVNPADCPVSSGRVGLAECQDPAFERCHREACAPILEGHRRRMQAAANPQACTAETLPARTTAVNSACCSSDECIEGHPDTCSTACADVFLPWWRDCEASLGKSAVQFEPTVQLCEAAGGTSISIAMQLGVECTDGTSTADCVPECSEAYHGFLMLLNIGGGDDSKLSCELHHGFYSWVGAATDGGYLGSDFETFFSAVVSGAAGVYVGMLLADAGISTELTITPGQSVSVSGDSSLAQPPLWGSGGFTVQERGSLTLTYLAFGPSASFVVAGGSLSLASMAVPAAVLGAAEGQLSGAGSTLRLSEITVPEVPDWGILTVTTTVGPDGFTKTNEPATPFNGHARSSWFTVTSGLCAISDGGRCVGRPNGYGRNEDCTIIVGGGGGVLGECGVFDTQNGVDYITLPDGSRHWASDCPAGAALAPGDNIGWYSDFSWQGSVGNIFNTDNGCAGKGTCGLPYSGNRLGGGWQICFV
jgi:hypothetical protein